MIPRKSKREGDGGLQEGLLGTTHREGSVLREGSTPYDLYNTDFSVWECIIIIGGGVGARRGGVTAKLN